jgi:hypothetical protein
MGLRPGTQPFLCPGPISCIPGQHSYSTGWVARANSFARGASDEPAQSEQHHQTSLAAPPSQERHLVSSRAPFFSLSLITSAGLPALYQTCSRQCYFDAPCAFRMLSVDVECQSVLVGVCKAHDLASRRHLCIWIGTVCHREHPEDMDRCNWKIWIVSPAHLAGGRLVRTCHLPGNRRPATVADPQPSIGPITCDPC